MATCKIGIIENFKFFSSIIKADLESKKGFEVVGIGVNHRNLQETLKGNIPDIIIIDIIHTYHSGVKLIKKARKLFPGVPFLVISANLEVFDDFEHYGVAGIIYADDFSGDLIQAIHTICERKLWFSEQGKVSILSNTKNKNSKALTKRELEVLKHFCDGFTYKEIGMKLFISARTVETHKKNIMSKLKLNSKAELIKYGARNFYSTN